MADLGREVTPADASQSERLHTFSHTLRNKLAGLYEAMKHIQDEQDIRQREELATHAEIQFYHALREIEQVLDDLAVQRNVRIVRRDRIDMKAVVEKALQHNKERLARKDQHVHAEAEEGVIALGDGYYIDEMMHALLTNASKFSRHGGSIRILLSRSDGSALLRVTDEGVGMSSEDLENVFKRFAWLSSRSTAGEAQGRSTLSKVKNWVQELGGSIEAASDGPGHGCTFTVRLPLAD